MWANLKGAVGRQYTTDTTFQQVRQRLEHAFATLKSETVAGRIRTACEHLQLLRTQIDQEEEEEEEESEEDEEDEEEESEEEEDEEEEDEEDK